MPLDLEIDEIFTDEITESVIYRRGADEIRIDVVPDESVFEVQNTNGAIIQYQTKDFVFPSRDLDFGDGPVEPNRKDIVVLNRKGCEATFEVLPDLALQHYRTEDGYGYCYRIFTKEKPSS